MRVSNILVINVTLHRKIIYTHISNLNMRVSNILVINVTLKEHMKLIYTYM